jgi:hypothetical protein
MKTNIVCKMLIIITLQIAEYTRVIQCFLLYIVKCTPYHKMSQVIVQDFIFKYLLLCTSSLYNQPFLKQYTFG